MNKVAGASYLEFDTSIDCSSTEYKHFVILDLIFIAVYMAVPLIWLILLWRKRDRMNPWLSNRKYSLHIRNADAGLAPYSKFGSDTARAVLPYLHDIFPAPLQPVQVFCSSPLISSTTSSRCFLSFSLSLFLSLSFHEMSSRVEKNPAGSPFFCF
jgi:hypothetical protein